MVSTATIIAFIAATAVCFLLPIAITVVFRIKYKINFIPVLAGIVVYVLFVLILEQLLHYYVLVNGIITNTMLIAVYAALAAGIFEEGGRFLAFSLFLRDKHGWKDGIAYGIGHGGFETIYIGFSYLSNLVCCYMINNGTFDAVLGTQDSYISLKDQLIGLSPASVFMGTMERIFAYGIQVALTLVVLYAIRTRKYVHILTAIICHALVDFAAMLYQTGILDIYIVELIVFMVFIGSVFFLIKSKKMFDVLGPEENRYGL